LIEVLFVLGTEIVADIGEVEACSCALRGQIHAIEIADAVIVDQGRDSLLGDRQGQPINIAPFGPQARIPNNVSDDAVSAISGLLRATRVFTLGGMRNAWLTAPPSTCIS
jgi:hypothetical protein